MEIRNIHPDYPSLRERQERLEEASRQCLEALAALKTGEKEDGA